MMQLTSDQVEHFYHIWFKLLHYVHEQRHLAPNLPDTPKAMSISPDDALLPFEGRIIYDSLLEPYSISFGPGFRSGLNDAYRNAQEREGIITTLMPAEVPTNLQKVRKEILARNTKILNAFRKEETRRGLSHTTVEKYVSNIDAFGQYYLLAQNPPRGLLDMTPTDVQTYFITSGNETLKNSFKRYVRFLDETVRIDDYEQIKSLYAVLQ